MAPTRTPPRRSKRAVAPSSSATRAISTLTNGTNKKRTAPKNRAKKANREPQYDVQEVRGHQFIAGGRSTKSQYLVKWVGYPETENSWEPEDNIDAASKIEAYWSRTRSVQPEGRDGNASTSKPKSSSQKRKSDASHGQSSDAEEAEAEDVLGQEDDAELSGAAGGENDEDE